jgi:iron-sulfur cluster assembly accessory protein
MKAAIQITQNAGKQLTRIAKEHNCPYILFYVKGGGCNGFNYKLEPTRDPPTKRDEFVSFENIKVIIDESSVFHLLGTKIDWKKDIMGETFSFENPNASANCGCGTSFSIGIK